MQPSENQIQFSFKIYKNIVCLSDGLLYQLAHCPKKRTKVFRKLTYNEKRKAYYINGQLVTKKRLKKLCTTQPQTYTVTTTKKCVTITKS